MLWKLAGVQLAHSYRLPTSGECGGTMTHRYDMQNGAEGMLFMLAAQASGSDILAGIGSCYNAVGMSAEMMVMQTEWLRAAEHVTRGMSFAAFGEATAGLLEAGPGGNYLMDDLTLGNLRTGEFFAEGLLDYSGYVEEGTPLLAKAHERAEELVAGYEDGVGGDVREGLERWFGRRLSG